MSNLRFGCGLILVGLCVLWFGSMPWSMVGPVFVIGGAGWLVSTINPPADRGTDADD